MLFKRENTKPIDNPTEKQVRSSLKKLQGSKRSFASISVDGGGFIQMAGGGYSCILEKKSEGAIYRANQDVAIVPWQEETILLTSCGDFKVLPNEYFNIDQVVEAFLRYLVGDGLDYLGWELVGERS